MASSRSDARPRLAPPVARPGRPTDPRGRHPAL